jgi:tetratricopeptide (TPR) repeat protein
VALKIIKINSAPARLALIAVAVAAIVSAWFFGKWNFANAVAERIDTAQPEAKSVAEWLISLAPNDPQTHFAAGRTFEKTFDPGDLDRSLAEYERAAALSPNHYVMWLNVGKARSLNGDAGGALSAYAQALRLAPNYASVQWAYGNALIRQGRADEGFAMIAKAAAANPDYARTTALTALEMFDGDLTRVRSALGDSDLMSASLAAVLAKQGRFDEAVEIWSRIGDRSAHQKLGISLIEQLATARKYQLAARISAGQQGEGAEKPESGKILNGGFETNIKLRDAGLFEWQIAAGAKPQIGQAEGGAHGGRYSLIFVFDTFATTDFRSISQIVPVEPGAEYELELFYKSDVKSSASLRWEIADAANLATIAAAPPITPAGEWTSTKVKFAVPAGADAVIVRLGRDGCNGPSCPFSGKVSFDDLSLRKL